MVTYEALSPTVVPVRRAVTVPSKPVSLEGVSFRGPANASVIMLVFSDSQCPFSAGFARNTLPAILGRHAKTGDLKIGVRLFPVNRQNPSAVRAAAVADCARHHGVLEDARHALRDDWPLQ
jgi:protein-disulfide isomerase